MPNRESVLVKLRDYEQRGLAELPPAGPSDRVAATKVVLSREEYACIERPPTRHRKFVIHTNWLGPDFVTKSHAVYVQGRSWSYRFPVVQERAGLFGGSVTT